MRWSCTLDRNWFQKSHPDTVKITPQIIKFFPKLYLIDQIKMFVIFRALQLFSPRDPSYPSLFMAKNLWIEYFDIDGTLVAYNQESSSFAIFKIFVGFKNFQILDDFFIFLKSQITRIISDFHFKVITIAKLILKIS